MTSPSSGNPHFVGTTATIYCSPSPHLATPNNVWHQQQFKTSPTFWIGSEYEVLYRAFVRPTDIQPIGNELAIKWDDGTESFIALEKLRRACPCAGCKGETDVMGNLYIAPPKPLRPESFQLKGIAHVGGYAIQPQWADGHSTGLYSFEYLRRHADTPS